MNYLTLKLITRHTNIKTKNVISNNLLHKPIKAEWSLNYSNNKKISTYLSYILFSYYTWNIIPKFKPNSKQIYITKLEFQIQSLYLISLTKPEQKLTFTLYKSIQTHKFNNFIKNWTNLFITYSLFSNKTYINNNNNKLNFDTKLNSKFNLFGLFWFHSNIKMKSKYLFSKLNLS